MIELSALYFITGISSLLNLIGYLFYVKLILVLLIFGDPNAQFLLNRGSLSIGVDGDRSLT